MLNCSKALWGDKELAETNALECKCCLCESLVILWDMGMRDPSSAGHMHFTVWWGRRLSGSNTSAGTKQGLKEEKSSFLFASPPTKSLHFTFGDDTWSIPLQRTTYGEVHSPMCHHTNVFLLYLIFSLIFLNTVHLHCMYKMLCKVWFWFCFSISISSRC